MGRVRLDVTRMTVILMITAGITGADGLALLPHHERGADGPRQPQSIFAATRSPDTDPNTAVDHEAEAVAGRVIWPLWTQCGEFHITKVTIMPSEARGTSRTRGSRSFVGTISGTFITQVKGARLVPRGEPITEADRLNGLEWHGVVRFTALAYRVHGTSRPGEAPQWSPWRDGAPTNSDRQLEKRQGKWQVSLAKSPMTGTATDVAKNTQAITCAELPR
jgi:hypothetical protein